MTSATARNAALDALRVLSLLGVVTLHVAAAGGFHGMKPLGFLLDELSRFAVPVFFILSAYFWKPDELEHPLRLIRRVTTRVGLPFLAWVVITMAWTAGVRPSEQLDLSPSGIAYALWTGQPAFHLWFLPALIVGTAIVSLSGRYLGWGAALALTLVLFGLGLLLGAYAPLLLQRSFPLWVFRNGLFFAPVFLAAGVLLRQHRDAVARLPRWLIAMAVVAFAAAQLGEGAAIVHSYPMGHDFSLSTLGYGIAVMMLFMRLDLRGAVWSALGRATFTAYLVHLLVIATLVDILHLGPNPLMIATTLSISLAIGLAWQRVLRRVWGRTPSAFGIKGDGM